ncbi:MAG: lycopene cyclase family protein [Balneolaceae bacterium]
MKQNHFEYIIAGAGAAGLSLLWHLLQSPLGTKPILVADRNLSNPPNKTWSFWDDRHPFMELTERSWNKLAVRSAGERFQETLKSMRYHAIRSDRYHKTVLELARKHPSVTLLEADILELSCRAGRAQVKTSVGEYSGTWMFQSIIPPKTGRCDNSLIQHFTGFDIRTEKPLFDPDVATIMDFDTVQRDGLTFFYLLPFTEKEALVEYTLFSPQRLERSQYEMAIERYLRDRFQLNPNDYTITRKESGEIPMEDRRYPLRHNRRTWNIGTAGGLTKGSTGYTFTRIHRHSREIIRSLTKTGKPPRKKGESTYRFRVYDMMILYLMQHEQQNAREIFHELFRKNSIERVLEFLDEKTRFSQEVALFSTLPWNPFFRSIWKMKHRILTGG